ncbi:MAG: guanine deaminase [Rhodobacteraceae bacterium]|nr:guanine deaminase [Paracoccaceae bacterium]
MPRTDNKSLVLGQTVQLVADPFRSPPEGAILHRQRGGVLLQDGTIRQVGEAGQLLAENVGIATVDYGDALILPGFVDCHAHFPQTGIIASWGRRLIDWLHTYTFPEEARFGDPGYAREIAELYLDLCIANGTTTVSAFCTSHPESVDAFFAAAAARNMCVAGGKVLMDRNAPDALLDSPEGGYEQSRALIERWHGNGRLRYAVTPRFALTSSPEQLAAAGTLWREHPDTLLQTHLSEQPEEIRRVRSMFPDSDDYLGIYERHGLVGRGAIMGHAIHLEEREKTSLADTGTGVAHCPTSNTFIGSGLCDVASHVRSGVRVGLGTDVGGGSSFSMLATMRAAYEIGQLRGDVFHPAQLLWLATEGSASVMRLEGRIGRLERGAEGDICVLDPEATPLLAARCSRAESISEILFSLIMLGDDRSVRQVLISGRPVKPGT